MIRKTRMAVITVTETMVYHDLEAVPKVADLAYQGDGLDVYVQTKTGVKLTPSRWQAIDNAALHLYSAFGIPASAVRNVRLRKRNRKDRAMEEAKSKTERMF